MENDTFETGIWFSPKKNMTVIEDAKINVSIVLTEYYNTDLLNSDQSLNYFFFHLLGSRCNWESHLQGRLVIFIHSFPNKIIIFMFY